MPVVGSLLVQQQTSSVSKTDVWDEQGKQRKKSGHGRRVGRVSASTLDRDEAARLVRSIVSHGNREVVQGIAGRRRGCVHVEGMELQDVSLGDLVLDEDGGIPVPGGLVLVVDGPVVLGRVKAALENEADERLELTDGVSRPVDVSQRPVALPEHQAGEAVGTGSEEAGRAADKALVHDGDLEEVLGKGARLNAVVVGLADAAKEAHRTWPAKLEIQHAEHETLRLQDLLDSEASIDHVHDLLNRRTVNLLVLGRHENGCGTDELELAKRDNLDRQEAVNAVDSQEESLGQEVEPRVNLDKPVHQDGSHRPHYVRLDVHVVRVRGQGGLGL